MPELRPDRPRAISFTTVDVSRVNFFFSSQLSNQVSDGSGSLIDAVRAKEQKSKQQVLSKTNTTPKSNDVKVEDNKRSIFMEDERVYKEMLQTTAAFYRSTKSMACFETESNTSSVSDTESDDANFAGSMRPITAASCCSDRIILAAPTRPELSLIVSSSATPKTETTPKSVAASKANFKSVSSSLHPSAMTMGDALNFSQHGRYVASGGNVPTSLGDLYAYFICLYLVVSVWLLRVLLHFELYLRTLLSRGYTGGHAMKFLDRRCHACWC